MKLLGLFFSLFFINAVAYSDSLSQQFDAVVLAKNLDTPWAIAYSKNKKLFVSLRSGIVVEIIDGGAIEVLNLPSVAEFGEGGLMGLDLDPNFNINGYAYIAYSTRSRKGNHVKLHTVLSRIKYKNNRFHLDKVLLDSIGAAAIHNGGRVKIGPDNKIYLTIGDAGTPDFAQDRLLLNGKILRLNLDGSIPSNNPYPNSYIYSYGHRNPQGLAWDEAKNKMYATEHGPSGWKECCRDEVNEINPGNNYGWPLITGRQVKSGLVPPLITSGSKVTWAPSGAAFIAKGIWRNSLVFTGLRGEALYRYDIENNTLNRYLENRYGRLRDVIYHSANAIMIATCNRDGRGRVKLEDDKIILIKIR